MKPVRKQSLGYTFTGLALALIAVAIAGLVLVTWWRRTSSRNASALSQAPAVTASTNPAGKGSGSPAATSPPPRAAVLPNNPGFQERPFPVAFQSATIQWTSEDGRDTNIIQQLAHNPLEVQRMVEENPRIYRRQLVYLKDTAAAVFERAKLTKEPVQQLTLPGVDGKELQFDIVSADNNNGSSRRGMFSGHLAGDADSFVTMAFIDGREAYTVLSTKQNLFVVAEPREPGQVIVKVIDPNTYGQGPGENGDDALKTQPPGK